MVKGVIGLQTRDGWEPSDDEILAAREYLDTELPFFMNLPELCGVDSSFFAYHGTPAFAPYLYGDDSRIQVSRNQGFVKLNQV